MLITLSGLDGAGKSTLAEDLRADLQKDGSKAVVCHMNKQIGIYAYIRNLRDAVLGQKAPKPERPSPVPGAAVTGRGARAMLLEIRRRIIWNKELRRWVDLVDLAIFHFYRLYVEKVRGQILIMDRYFYDRITDIADGTHWRYLRWFSRLVPPPDLAVFVDVDPQEAFARKGEYSVESMIRRRAIYGEVISWTPNAVNLPNDDRRRAARELHRLVEQRRRGSPAPRLASGR